MTGPQDTLAAYRAEITRLTARLEKVEAQVAAVCAWVAVNRVRQGGDPPLDVHAAMFWWERSRERRDVADEIAAALDGAAPLSAGEGPC